MKKQDAYIVILLVVVLAFNDPDAALKMLELLLA